MVRRSAPFSSKWVAKQWRLCIMKHSRHYASSRTMLPELIPTDSARVLTQNTRHSFPAFSSCHADGQEEIPCTRCLKIHAPSNVCTEDCSVSTSIPTLPF